MANTEVDGLALLKEAGALLEGHFVLSSGLHSNAYVQCAQLGQHPVQVALAAQALAQQAPPADLVVSPAMGGIIIGHEVARVLGLRHIFTERDGGTMVLRRGFAIKPGERVLVVEDVFTTGKSTKEVMDVVTAAGGVVVGAVSIVNRAEGALPFQVPHHSLVRLGLLAMEPAKCHLCASGSTAVKPGSRPDEASSG